MFAAVEDVVELGNGVAAFDANGHACGYMVMWGEVAKVCCWVASW